METMIEVEEFLAIIKEKENEYTKSYDPMVFIKAISLLFKSNPFYFYKRIPRLVANNLTELWSQVDISWNAVGVDCIISS